MDVGGYRHNNKSFCENFTFPNSINRGKTSIIEVTIIEVPKPSGTSPPSSLPLMVTSVQEEIRSSVDCVDTARGRTLERLKNSFK